MFSQNPANTNLHLYKKLYFLYIQFSPQQIYCLFDFLPWLLASCPGWRACSSGRSSSGDETGMRLLAPVR